MMLLSPGTCVFWLGSDNNWINKREAMLGDAYKAFPPAKIAKKQSLAIVPGKLPGAPDVAVGGAAAGGQQAVLVRRPGQRLHGRTV